MRLRDYYRLGRDVVKARVNQELGRFTMPYKYSFVLTNVCQSRCKTCNIWKIYEDNPDMKDKEMDLDELKQVIDNVKDDVLWLNLSGGEPFLFEDIVEFAEYCFETCPNLFMVNIPTNAISNTLISKRLGELLAVKPDHVNLTVTISLDGVGEQHDEIRGIPGNWDRAMDLYEDLQEFEEEYDTFEAGFQTTVSQYNIHNLDEIFDFTRQASVTIFTFAHESYYFYNEGNSQEVQEAVDKDTLMEGIDYISSEYTINSLKDIVPKLYLKLAKRFYENPDQHLLPPSSGRGSITVDPYGKVKLFSYFGSDMGDLRQHDYNMQQLLQTDTAQEELRKIDNDEGEIYWVNCEAFPTMFQHPGKAVKKAFLG